MHVLSPAEMRRILEVTDTLGIHRESVRVPLLRRGTGAVRLTPAAHVEITAPTGDLSPWLATLPESLRALDLGAVRRSA